MSAQPVLVKWTERQVLDLLCLKYTRQSGNGDRYAIAEHVRSAAGFDAKRTADFVSMDLWPSAGLALHGHEVKVSRSDWLTELKDPDKAEAFRPFMDYWWLVVSDAGIVKDGELPAGWGLLAPTSGGGILRTIRQAKRTYPADMPKSMMAAFVRSVAKTAHRRKVSGHA